MNQGKYVFAQIAEFLPQCISDTFVKQNNGNKYIKHFTCWNQLLCMVFGQLTNRDSLRDLIVAISTHEGKSYHLGFGKSVTRSNLAKVNENSDYRIFESFAYHLVVIVGYSLKIDRSTYETLQVLGISLLDKTPVNELFKNVNHQNVKEPFYNQLSLSLF